MTDDERAAVYEIAGDLQESGRASDAFDLLESETPDRLNGSCPACGAWFDAPCTEPGDKPGPSYWSYKWPMLVPHASRAFAPRYATQQESHKEYGRGAELIARAKARST